MKNYLISPAAEQDIDELITYIFKGNSSAALKLLDRLYEAMEMIAEQPLIGHERKDLTSKPVRFWPAAFHYLIIYKIAEPIEIVRVLSGYRDIANILSNQNTTFQNRQTAIEMMLAIEKVSGVSDEELQEWLTV